MTFAGGVLVVLDVKHTKGVCGLVCWNPEKIPIASTTRCWHTLERRSLLCLMRTSRRWSYKIEQQREDIILIIHSKHGNTTNIINLFGFARTLNIMWASRYSLSLKSVVSIFEGNKPVFTTKGFDTSTSPQPHVVWWYRSRKVNSFRKSWRRRQGVL